MARGLDRTSRFGSRPRRAFHRVEVTGRDRCHFFKRPIMPNRDPLPLFRSDPNGTEVNAQGQIGANRNHPANREKTIQLSSSEWVKDESGFAFSSPRDSKTMPSSTDSATSQHRDGSRSLQCSKMTQTRLRESFAQTEPCSLDHRDLSAGGCDAQECQEQMGLADLSFGQGLPVTNPLELSTAEDLLRNHISLASATDFVARQNLLENREKIKWQARMHRNRRTKEARTEHLARLLDELFLASEDLLQYKLQGLSQDQQTKDQANFSAMVRYHQRHISALERKAIMKTSRLRFGSVPFQTLPKYQFDIKGNVEDRLGSRRLAHNSNGVQTARDTNNIFNHEETDQGLDTTLKTLENIQEHLEQDLNRRYSSILKNENCAKNELISSQNNKRPSSSPVYLKRSERYNHLLDSAYSEIQSAKLDHQRQNNPNISHRQVLNQGERIFIMEMLRRKHLSMVAKSSARFKHQIGNQQRRSLLPSNTKSSIGGGSNGVLVPSRLVPSDNPIPSTCTFVLSDGTSQQDGEQLGSGGRSMFGFDSHSLHSRPIQTNKIKLREPKCGGSNRNEPNGDNDIGDGNARKLLSTQHEGSLSKFVRHHVKENIGLSTSDSESSSMELVSFAPKTFQEDISAVSRVPKKALNSQLEDLITIVLSKTISELDLEHSTNFDKE